MWLGLVVAIVGGCGEPDCPAGTHFEDPRCVADDAGTDGSSPGDAGTDAEAPEDAGEPADAGPDATTPADAGAELTGTSTTISGGYANTCVIRAGFVWCWGLNSQGQVGDGTMTDRPRPYRTSVASAIEVGSVEWNSCALGADGSVLCWGRFGGSPSPSGVAGIEGAHQLAVGNGHACVVRDGTVLCWGSNFSGQLGDGTTADSTVPVPVPGLPAVVDVAAGWYHSCALAATGEVWCWGSNAAGQLGDGSMTDRTSPVRVVGVASATMLSAGANQTCALLRTRTIACWGDNEWGQLGNGSTTPSATPVAVAGITDAVQISVGHGHVCALRASGSISCWGAGTVGALGDGTSTSSSTPVDVIGLTSSPVEVGALGDHSCAWLETGDLACWGANGQGQLGTGAGGSSATPVLVTF